jgi:UDP-N-acetylmuramoyl-tripeptide--D-alanyl-D-alanine ligase
MWSKKSLEAALHQQVPDLQFGKITIDSRNVNKSDIFIGIKGENFDGSNFAIDALTMGASISITSFLPEKYSGDRLIVVENTYSDGLIKLATYKRDNSDATYIGVTGSIGKTTTKEMLKLVLSNSYASHGNLNNHYGLPLSLSNIDYSDFGIFELGMSSPGEISFLSKILRPDIAIITGIAPAHLEYFTSLDGIAAAKAEIIDGLSDSGVLVVNFDSPSLNVILKYSEEKNVVGYSYQGNAKAMVTLIKSEVVESNGILFTNVSARYGSGPSDEINYTIRGIGKDLVENSLAILTTLVVANLDLRNIEKLIDFETVNGRGKIHYIESCDVKLIDESYNSNPTSLSAALYRMNLYSQSTKYKRKVAILGDMLELGPNEVDLHCNVINDIKKYEIDSLILVGGRMRYLYEIVDEQFKVAHFNNSTDVVTKIGELIESGDLVMVKGSNGMKMSAICSAIKNLLD